MLQNSINPRSAPYSKCAKRWKGKEVTMATILPTHFLHEFCFHIILCQAVAALIVPKLLYKIIFCYIRVTFKAGTVKEEGQEFWEQNFNAALLKGEGAILCVVCAYKAIINNDVLKSDTIKSGDLIISRQ